VLRGYVGRGRRFILRVSSIRKPSIYIVVVRRKNLISYTLAYSYRISKRVSL